MEQSIQELKMNHEQNLIQIQALTEERLKLLENEVQCQCYLSLRLFFIQKEKLQREKLDISDTFTKKLDALQEKELVNQRNISKLTEIELLAQQQEEIAQRKSEEILRWSALYQEGQKQIESIKESENSCKKRLEQLETINTSLTENQVDLEKNLLQLQKQLNVLQEEKEKLSEMEKLVRHKRPTHLV